MRVLSRLSYIWIGGHLRCDPQLLQRGATPLPALRGHLPVGGRMRPAGGPCGSSYPQSAGCGCGRLSLSPADRGVCRGTAMSSSNAVYSSLNVISTRPMTCVSITLDAASTFQLLVQPITKNGALFVGYLEPWAEYLSFLGSLTRIFT